jgi:hypothetical protein
MIHPKFRGFSALAIQSRRMTHSIAIVISIACVMLGVLWSAPARADAAGRVSLVFATGNRVLFQIDGANTFCAPSPGQTQYRRFLIAPSNAAMVSLLYAA